MLLPQGMQIALQKVAKQHFSNACNGNLESYHETRQPFKSIYQIGYISHFKASDT